MRPNAAVLAALASLPLAGCGDLFALRVEEPSLCLTLEEQSFPGADFELHTKELSYDLSPALPEEAKDDDVEFEVQLTSFEIRPRGDTQNLDFLRAAELRLVDGDQEVPVATYRAGAADTAAFTVDEDRDIGDAVKKADLRFVLEVSGDLPDTAWSADAEACFHVVSRIHYF